MKESDWNRIVLWLFVLILIGFGVFATIKSNQFKFDSVIMLALLVGVYLIRNKIKLHPFHFFLFGVFLALHNLGVFGAYAFTPLGLEFDYYVHGFFGLIAAFMLYRAYRHAGPYKGWFMYVAIIAIVLGLSAFHELVEYIGAITLGEGEGLLFIGVGDLDRFDTQKDMLNNLIGGVIGLVVYWVYEKFKRRR
jgi:uncharacterized membrane protein YjdF